MTHSSKCSKELGPTVGTTVTVCADRQPTRPANSAGSMVILAVFMSGTEFKSHRVYGISCRNSQPRLTAYWGVSQSRELTRQLETFGANLRRERMARGITQEKLSEAVDLNIRTVQKIERGETNILITTAIRIQRALGCAWESLVAGIK